MRTLEAGIQALGWQGGTLYQVIEEAELLVRDDKHNKSTYKYGYRDGNDYLWGAGIEQYSIPVNSWDSDPICTLSFIAGLKAGIQSRKTSLNL